MIHAILNEYPRCIGIVQCRISIGPIDFPGGIHFDLHRDLAGCKMPLLRKGSGATLKYPLALFLCFLLLFSARLAGQETSASKAGDSKSKKKESAAYSASTAAKTQFMRESGYRNGRPGYVVVYRKPLACGGADDISNLEWLTVSEAKAKEKAERKGCK